MGSVGRKGQNAFIVRSILWKVLSKFRARMDVAIIYFVNLKAGTYIYQANHLIAVPTLNVAF